MFLTLTTICRQGLTGVPWSSRNVGMGDKITQFFEGLTKFQQQLLIEEGMGYFYFVLGRFAIPCGGAARARPLHNGGRWC